MSRWGLIPPMGIHTSGDHFMVSPEFLENHENQMDYVTFHQECRTRFSGLVGCDTQRITTTLDERKASERFTINNLIGNKPNQKLTYIPKFDWVDLGLALLSALSTWTGFSVIGCNPFYFKDNEEDDGEPSCCRRFLDTVGGYITACFRGIAQCCTWTRESPSVPIQDRFHAPCRRIPSVSGSVSRTDAVSIPNVSRENLSRFLRQDTVFDEGY